MAKTAIPVDTQWLIDTLAKNDEVHDNPDGTVTDAGNVTTQLEQETQDAPETSSTKPKNRISLRARLHQASKKLVMLLPRLLIKSLHCQPLGVWACLFWYS